MVDGNPASRLKVFREFLGYSQARLGRKLGVNEGTVRRWEKGIVKPQTTKMQVAEAILALLMTDVHCLPVDKQKGCLHSGS